MNMVYGLYFLVLLYTNSSEPLKKIKEKARKTRSKWSTTRSRSVSNSSQANGVITAYIPEIRAFAGVFTFQQTPEEPSEYKDLAVFPNLRTNLVFSQIGLWAHKNCLKGLRILLGHL